MEPIIKKFQLFGAIVIFIATGFAFFIEINKMFVARDVQLADLLLLFIYLEVVGMVLSFYGSNRIRLTYPLFIAITALARLMILQQKNMDLTALVYEGGAILLVALAILVLRLRRSKLIRVQLSKDDI
ncbi:MAG: phosphate starvation-inducible protein PhoH [Pelagibacterales bacterium]|nr:phosphate starvation-inducible protein PhoH [Pelagibacterales bacterium]